MTAGQMHCSLFIADCVVQADYFFVALLCEHFSLPSKTTGLFSVLEECGVTLPVVRNTARGKEETNIYSGAVLVVYFKRLPPVEQIFLEQIFKRGQEPVGLLAANYNE